MYDVAAVSGTMLSAITAGPTVDNELRRSLGDFVV